MTFTVGSLFSGIGGLDLGLERAGMEVIWNSEIDPYASQVLKKHWPKVTNHGDIKTIQWADVVRPNVICGGYPCQPFSLAGRRAGEHDPRHLWPWVRDAISHLRPDYAILENVRGHLSMGGMSVIGDLTAVGYDAEWHIISAASLGACHRRDRLFIVAYPNNARSRTPRSGNNADWTTQVEKQQYDTLHRTSRLSSNVADHDREWHGVEWTPETITKTRIFGADNTRRTAANVGGEWWKAEPGMGRVANGVPNRVDRLRGLGNAVVPQVAELVGRMILEHAGENQ